MTSPAARHAPAPAPLQPQVAMPALADAVPAPAAGLPWLGVLVAVLLMGLLTLAALYWRQRQRGRALSASLDAARQHSRADDDEGHLPGLVSRARFEQALAEAAERCDRAMQPRSATVLFVNLDNFRLVNDTYGFKQGDEVIAQAAQRLLQLCGAGTVVTRMGGDEFLVLLETDLSSACDTAGRLCQDLARPYGVRGRPDLGLACSIGLASYPAHGARARLVGHAATALRIVKLAGGGDYMVFEPQMAVDQREQAELLADLRQAVVRGELELFYQPKVDAQTQQITAAEALLRWHHPKRGMVSPALFIPLAERHGLIGPIGNWVIEDACRQAAEWRARGLRMRVAINISAYQMRQDDLVDRIEAQLKRHQLQPGRFTCEITETVAMEDTQVTQRTFQRLREAGVHVSIDDFGVGQTSLSYLRRLPARELKIDASLSHDVETSADARAIVEAVVRLAHALNLKVVAEGVETQGQRNLLVRMGCDQLQGYLFARPMPANALATWALLDDDRLYTEPASAEAAGQGVAEPGAPGLPGLPGRPGAFSDSLFRETQPAPLARR